VRLPSLVHLDLEARVPGLELGTEAVDLGRFLAEQDREHVGRLREEPLEHVARDPAELGSRRDGLTLHEAEELPTTAVRDARVTAPVRTDAAAAAIASAFSAAPKRGS
jgi:hypothetical protein